MNIKHITIDLAAELRDTAANRIREAVENNPEHHHYLPILDVLLDTSDREGLLYYMYYRGAAFAVNLAASGEKANKLSLHAALAEAIRSAGNLEAMLLSLPREQKRQIISLFTDIFFAGGNEASLAIRTHLLSQEKPQ